MLQRSGGAGRSAGSVLGLGQRAWLFLCTPGPFRPLLSASCAIVLTGTHALQSRCAGGRRNVEGQEVGETHPELAGGTFLLQKFPKP